MSGNKQKQQVSIFDIAQQMPSLIKDLPKIGKALYYNYTINPTTITSVTDFFKQTVQQYPHHNCIYYLDKKWTYREIDEWSNRLAHQFKQYNINKGDVVAVLLENRPELLVTTLALVKIGGVAALINTAQKGKTLLHSFTLAQPKLVLIGNELMDNYLEISEQVPIPKNYIFRVSHVTATKKHAIPKFDILAFHQPKHPPKNNFKIQAKDPYLYIYTSGTTGLPKASIISHSRWIKSYTAFGLTNLRLQPNDILYVCLPFYHATAMVVCWSSVIAGGAAIVIKDKFSVSKFWDDIHYYKATGFAYVGELCRYLLNAPIHPLEQPNTLTKMIGNGLRPAIWQAFKQRFDITQIAEFYASSEGNIAFFNVFNLDATMGFSITNYAIVEYDLEQEQPILDKNGYMKKVPTNGIGLLLGEISDRYPYDGYTEKEKTEKTIFRNVFKQGDAWFNTNDLVKDMGYMHTQFVDRLGDTFRWKGENVATQEVENIINQYQNIEESIVYGVAVPEHNGKCGMARIILKDINKQIDWIKFYNYLQHELPTYAIPVFIRISTHTETTSTFKYQKSQLKEEAYHLAKIDDSLMLLKNKKYIPFSQKLYSEIKEGKLRL